MAAILEPDVIVTSYDVTSLCCRPQREHLWTYYLPSKFRCHSFNILGVKRWGSNQSLPVLEDQKKPGLNRVKMGQFRTVIRLLRRGRGECPQIFYFLVGSYKLGQNIH